MYNNEFEQKVEHRLEELSFSPSDVVWQKVELQIKQRKRRRRFFFWWLPLGLLCTGVAGWFFYHEFSSAPVQQQAVVNVPLQNTATISSAQPVTSTTKEQVVAEDESKLQNNPENVNEKAAVKEPIQKETPVTVLQQKKNDIKESKEPVAFEKKQQVPLVFKPVVKEKESTAKKEVSTTAHNPVVVKDNNVKTTDAVVVTKKEEVKTNETAVTNKKEETKTNETVVIDTKEEIKPAPEVKATDVAVAVNQPQTVSDSTATVMNTKPAVQKTSSANNKKVEWFARVGTGISGMSQFSTELFAPFAADVFSSAAQSSAGSGSVYNSQSPVKSGTGFSAGIELRTIAKKRSSFSVGLNYAYYSTSLKTGSMIYANTLFNVSNYNSYVNNYMRAGDSAIFHNHYNFFELPLLYHLRISKQNKRPLTLNTGLSYNYMFASNANYYSRSSGAYYYDKTLFNRSQLHFKLGISSSFIKKEDYPLQVGLQYQFGMTGIWKQSLTLNQHLSYTGIEVLWRLHK